MQGYEDVTLYTLSPEREQELLDKQIECNFIWTNKDGHGLGVIMNYIARDGSIWLTATSQRPRIKALKRDPRASVVISSTGTDMGGGKQITYVRRKITVGELAFALAEAGKVEPQHSDSLGCQPLSDALCRQDVLGAGEAAQGPTPAAIANAIFDATGARLMQLPMTPELVRRAIATGQ